MKRTFLVALGLSACVADSRVISLEREQFQNRPQNRGSSYRQDEDKERNKERLFKEQRGRNEEETSVEERQDREYDQVHQSQDHHGEFQEEQVFVLGNRKIIVTIRQEDNNGGITQKNHEKRSNGRNQRNNDEFQRNYQRKVGKQNLGRQADRKEGNFENERNQKEFRSRDNERSQRGSEERFGLQRERNQGGSKRNQNQDDEGLRCDFNGNQQGRRNQIRQKGQEYQENFKEQGNGEQDISQSNKFDQKSRPWDNTEPKNRSDSHSEGTQSSNHQSSQTKEVSSKTQQSTSQTSSQSTNQNQTSTKSDSTQTQGKTSTTTQISQKIFKAEMETIKLDGDKFLKGILETKKLRKISGDLLLWTRSEGLKELM